MKAEAISERLGVRQKLKHSLEPNGLQNFMQVQSTQRFHLMLLISLPYLGVMEMATAESYLLQPSF
jgi:hypothetical protein